MVDATQELAQTGLTGEELANQAFEKVVGPQLSIPQAQGKG